MTDIPASFRAHPVAIYTPGRVRLAFVAAKPTPAGDDGEFQLLGDDECLFSWQVQETMNDGRARLLGRRDVHWSLIERVLDLDQQTDDMRYTSLVMPTTPVV